MYFYIKLLENGIMIAYYKDEIKDAKPISELFGNSPS